MKMFAPHSTLTGSCPPRAWGRVLLASVALLIFSFPAAADPPSRAARIGYMTGNISFSPAGEEDWTQASLNRPLTTGDRLWTERRARMEIQLGVATMRMDGETSLTLLNLDDDTVQLQLNQGTLHVRVRRLDARQVFEIDTPNLAFVIRQAGEYRIDVDAEGAATALLVRRGRGEVYGDGASYLVNANQSYRFTGTDLRDDGNPGASRVDEFDRWAQERDRRYEQSGSARYVSSDVVGYEDLDSHGDWRNDPTWGNVWMPRVGSSGWAPYRDGHWSWIDPWGWTWVDDQPWGYAVSHYGRWAHLRNGWAWVPGPRTSRAYYAPALVAFIGGDNFHLTLSSGNVGGIGWFPLGPREVYRPSYAVSRGYYENVNRSNTVINNTVIINTYNTTNVTNIVYVNRDVPGAVVAVPATVFVQSQPISRAAVKLSRENLVAVPIALVPRMVPTERSVHGPAAKRDKPAGKAFDRRVVARATPPPAPIRFAAQQQRLAAQPGMPLDDAARKSLRPERDKGQEREQGKDQGKDRTGPNPAPRLIVPATVAAPVAAPPRSNRNDRPGTKAPDRADERKAAKGADRPVPVTPTQPPPTPPPQTTAPKAAPVRGKGQSDRRDKGDSIGNRDNRDNRDKPGRGNTVRTDAERAPAATPAPQPATVPASPPPQPSPRQADPRARPAEPRARLAEPKPRPAEPKPRPAEPVPRPAEPAARVQPPREQPPRPQREAPPQRERKDDRPAQRAPQPLPPAAARKPSGEIQPTPPKPVMQSPPRAQPAAEPPSKEIKPASRPNDDRGKGKDNGKDNKKGADDDDDEKRKGKK